MTNLYLKGDTGLYNALVETIKNPDRSLQIKIGNHIFLAHLKELSTNCEGQFIYDRPDRPWEQAEYVTGPTVVEAHLELSTGVLPVTKTPKKARSSKAK